MVQSRKRKSLSLVNSNRKSAQLALKDSQPTLPHMNPAELSRHFDPLTTTEESKSNLRKWWIRLRDGSITVIYAALNIHWIEVRYYIAPRSLGYLNVVDTFSDEEFWKRINGHRI